MAKRVLSRSCAHVGLEDYSTYMHGHTPQPRTFRIIGENGALYQTVFDDYATSLNVNLPQFSNYLDYDIIFINETCTLQTMYRFAKAPVVTLSSTGGLCIKSPIDLHFQVVSGYIFQHEWAVWGTEMGTAGLIDNSTLYSEIFNPNIQFLYQDANGCSRSQNLFLELQPNRVDGNIVLPDYTACLGDLYLIEYQFNEPYTGQVSYRWKPDSTITTNTYPTYETDYYSVEVFDYSTSCLANNEVNVVFNNKPVALIMGKTNYCRYDTVFLKGYSGNGYTYFWNVFDPQTQITTPYPDTISLAFLPEHAGTYKIILDVWLGDCSSSDTLWVKVFGNDFTPVIGYGSNNCIHEPPVQLISVNSSLPLYWSNGAFGLSAYFYASGVASAYYLDPETGCKSNDALITIRPQPNYDALLTGCFKKCPQFFPYKLGLYSLVPYDLRYWEWIDENVGVVDIGSYNTPPFLPLQHASTYWFETDYIEWCHTTSPQLVIENTETCSCTDEMNLSYFIKNMTCAIKDCRFQYTVDITIYNSSNVPLYFNSLLLQYAQLISCNGSSSCMPSVVPANGSAIYTIRFTPDILHSENFVFRFFSNEMDCYYDVPVSLNAEYYYNPCKIEKCKGKLESIHYMDEFREELPFTYHKIYLWVEHGMQLVDIWVEPGEILNYYYDSGSGNIDLIYLYDYNQLLQMAENGEDVCFHILLCRDDKMCKVEICISAGKLLDNVPVPFRIAPMAQNSPQEQRTDLQSDATLRIVPNPAQTDFTVIGIAEKNIAELKLLNMNGKEVKTETHRANMNIGDIAPAVYIVRVIDTGGKVYYLKLIKQ